MPTFPATLNGDDNSRHCGIESFSSVSTYRISGYFTACKTLEIVKACLSVCEVGRLLCYRNFCLSHNSFYALCANFYNDDSALRHSCLNCCCTIIYGICINKCTVNSVHLNRFMLEWTLYSNGTSF